MRFPKEKKSKPTKEKPQPQIVEFIFFVWVYRWDLLEFFLSNFKLFIIAEQHILGII